jgi:hypothetical protein
MKPTILGIVLFVWLSTAAVLSAAAATAINATVTERRSGAVMVSFPAGATMVPQRGDKVEFNTELQGIVVAAGAGQVSEAGSDFAWIEIEKGNQKVSFRALIHATGKPVAAQQTPAEKTSVATAGTTNDDSGWGNDSDLGWGDNSTRQSNNDNQLLTPILAANQACDFQGAFQLAQQTERQSPGNAWLQQNLPTLQTLAQRSMIYQQALGNAYNALEARQVADSIDFLKQAMQNASVQCGQDQQVRSLLGVARQLGQAEREEAIARARQKGLQSTQDTQRYRTKIAKTQASRKAFSSLLQGNLLGLLSAVNSSAKPALPQAQPTTDREMTRNIVQQIEQNNSEILNKWRASQGWQTNPPPTNSNSGW